MSNVTDNSGKEVEEYRFELGSLYKFDKDKHAYVHVWKNAFDNTKAKAIKAYENYLMSGDE